MGVKPFWEPQKIRPPLSAMKISVDDIGVALTVIILQVIVDPATKSYCKMQLVLGRTPFIICTYTTYGDS